MTKLISSAKKPSSSVGEKCVAFWVLLSGHAGQ
jgi:hypothetical protein